MSIGKKIRVSIKTTDEHLKSLGMFMPDIQKEVQCLVEYFGTKYSRMFPFDIKYNDIDRIIFVVRVLKKIEKCDGFKRHLKQYDKNNIQDHLFTAQVSGWFLDKGYEVTLEPELKSPEGGIPDLLVEIDEKKRIIVECKNINISNFFKLIKSKKLLKLFFKKFRHATRSLCFSMSMYLYRNLMISLAILV